MNIMQVASEAGRHVVGTPYPEGRPSSFAKRAYNQAIVWILRSAILITIWAAGRAFYLGDRNTGWQALFFLLILSALLFGTFNKYLYIVGGWLLLGLIVPVLWLRWGGSYHHAFDYLLLFVLLPFTAWLFDRKFLSWLREAPRYFLLSVLPAKWRGPKVKPPRHALREKHGLKFFLTFLLFFWVSASTADALIVWFDAEALPSDRARFARLRAQSSYPGLKVGVALSGGGYRAALVHAGVLNAFDYLGVPVTHITSVSGGSIIGAFYAAGGEPHRFRDAVGNNRFNLAREVTNFWNAARLVSPARLPGTATTLLPTPEFERTDVQANLLDSILLGGVTFDQLEQDGAPRLMLCATDLYSGATVGISRQGVLRRFMIKPGEKDAYLNFPVPPQQERYNFVPRSDGSGFPFDSRVSRLVAASGAFPGAFNGVAARMVVEQGKEPQHVMLADGGLSDNSALTVMNFAQLGDGDWALDLAISSDAGALFNEQQSIPALGELSRAVDIVYANVGVRREADACLLPKPQLLLTPGKYIDRRGARNDDAIRQAVWGAVEGADAATLRLFLNVMGEAPDAATAESVAADDEARRRLAARVADELKDALGTFMTTPTLKDNFEGETTRRLFRLGQLLAALEWTVIRKELDGARAKPKQLPQQTAHLRP